MDYARVIERSLRFIEENLGQPLSLSQVAEQFHFSKYHFHRLFSAVMGDTLADYVLGRRLNAALRMMRDTHLQIADIALALGFSAPGAFSRAFTKAFGMSPRALRRAGRWPDPLPLPEVASRRMKNINGDFVSDFTLIRLEPMQLSGLVFEADLAREDYRDLMARQAGLLLSKARAPSPSPCYAVFSDCRPGSSAFRMMLGLPGAFSLDLPLSFTVDVPPLLCARFVYRGDLLSMGDVLERDYARFLRITRQAPGRSHIHMIQRFPDIHDLLSDYQLIVPIDPLPSEAALLSARPAP